jgi:hypothetical protein
MTLADGDGWRYLHESVKNGRGGLVMVPPPDSISPAPAMTPSAIEVPKICR